MALGLIFILTFIDGLLIFGMVINGWGAFAACVYAYSKHDIPIVNIAVVAFAGVFVGENISYIFAKLYRGSIQVWLFRTFDFINSLRGSSKLCNFIPAIDPASWERVCQKFSNGQDHWALLILITGRWTPVAALIPASCAVSGVEYKRFVVASVIGCGLWSGLWNLIIWLGVNGYAEIVKLPT